MSEEFNEVGVQISGVLQKFNGDSTAPEDEYERIHIVNGEVARIDKIEKGEVVSSEIVKEVA